MDIRRRKILSWLGTWLLGICAIFFGSMLKSRMKFLVTQTSLRRLPLDLPQGISFHHGIIVNRRSNKYFVISAHCTHLGCTIDTMKEGELLCPCHGSRYSLDGKVVSGPARRNLKLLRHRIDEKENVLIIEDPV